MGIKEGEQRGKSKNKKKKEKEGEKTRPKCFVVLLYMKGVSERLQRSFTKRNISLYHKAGLMLRNLLVRPKDKLEKEEHCGVVYESECQVCVEIYIGETGRSLGERAEEHNKSIMKQDIKSAFSQHQHLGTL